MEKWTVSNFAIKGPNIDPAALRLLAPVYGKVIAWVLDRCLKAVSFPLVYGAR